MTYKQNTSDVSAIDTILDAEIQVNDFHATKALLEAMGFEPSATRRTVARNGSSAR